MRRAAAAFALAAILALPAGAAAAKKDKGERVTVMTRNVFLGADLGPAINAPDLQSAVNGAGEIYNELLATNFPERAVPLGKEIRRSKADLVGLQEVALWQEQVPSDGGGPPITGGSPATTLLYDFLDLLMDRVGPKYRVVGVQEEFAAELPANTDGDESTGGVFGADRDVRLTMRDVILARKGVKTKKLRTGHFETRFETSVGGIPVAADRGWLSTKAKVGDARFKFVNTHLEAFGDPRIREAQAEELTAGPLKTRKQLVLVGDLNSGTKKRHNIGRPELGHDPGDPLAFKVLKRFGMKDRGAVQSCCYSSEELTDPNAEFTHTVDHVLVKPKARRLDAFVTGNDPGEMTPSGLRPSDHGGVVSTLLLP